MEQQPTTLMDSPDTAALLEQLNQIQSEFAEALRDDLLQAKFLALATLSSLMKDQEAPASVRLKAALAILNRPLHELESLFQPPAKPAAEPQLNTSEHKSENIQNPQPSAANSPAINKVETCPCGSGKQFQQCCVHKTSTIAPHRNAPASSTIS